MSKNKMKEPASCIEIGVNFMNIEADLEVFASNMDRLIPISEEDTGCKDKGFKSIRKSSKMARKLSKKFKKFHKQAQLEAETMGVLDKYWR